MFIRRSKGFTLIELIMVIVIIGILAAIAVPKFINLRKDAQRAQCQGSLSSIQTALSTYYARRAIANTAAFPQTLHETAFTQFYLGEATLPSHPRGWNWSAYYHIGAGSATYTMTDATICADI